MKRGFEDVIQCQSNLQEIQLRSKKQLCNLELKCDNVNANSQAQIDQLKGEVTKLKA